MNKLSFHYPGDDVVSIQEETISIMERTILTMDKRIRALQEVNKALGTTIIVIIVLNSITLIINFLNLFDL